MKRTNLVLATTAVLSGVLLSTTSVVNAASASGTGNGIEAKDDTASATTTAEFSVDAGKLSFDAAPDFNFGKHSILDILQGQLQQQDNVIADGHNDSHTTIEESDDKLQSSASNGILQISDFRGAGSTWKLTAEISNFTNEDGEGTVKGLITLPGLSDGAAIGSTATTIWDSATAATNGQKVATVDLSKGSTLSLSDANNIQAGKYDATINWTLQNTAIAPTKG